MLFRRHERITRADKVPTCCLKQTTTKSRCNDQKLGVNSQMKQDPWYKKTLETFVRSKKNQPMIRSSVLLHVRIQCTMECRTLEGVSLVKTIQNPSLSAFCLQCCFLSYYTLTPNTPLVPATPLSKCHPASHFSNLKYTIHPSNIFLSMTSLQTAYPRIFNRKFTFMGSSQAKFDRPSKIHHSGDRFMVSLYQSPMSPLRKEALLYSSWQLTSHCNCIQYVFTQRLKYVLLLGGREQRERSHTVPTGSCFNHSSKDEATPL